MAHTNIISIILLFTYSPALQSPNVRNLALSPDMWSEENSELHQLGNDMSSKWPTGIVKYFVDNRSYDLIIAYKIRMIMNLIETISCVQFMPLHIPPNATSDSSWIHITNPMKERECTHELQHKGHGEILLVLGYDCLNKVEILHSILHGIGFGDEVTHPHRGNYIRVLWDNIQPAYQKLYNIRPDVKPDNLVEYDPLSVMHFGDRDFSINGYATVEPQLSGMIINPSESLSQLDKMKLSLYFGQLCNKREVQNILNTCKSTFHEEKGSKMSEKYKNKGVYKSENCNQSIDSDIKEESSEEDNTKNIKTIDKDYFSVGQDSNDIEANGEPN